MATNNSYRRGNDRFTLTASGWTVMIIGHGPNGRDDDFILGPFATDAEADTAYFAYFDECFARMAKEESDMRAAESHLVPSPGTTRKLSYATVPTGPWVEADAMGSYHAIISGRHYQIYVRGHGCVARDMKAEVKEFDSERVFAVTLGCAAIIRACEDHARNLTGRVVYGDASMYRGTGAQRIVG